MKYEIHINYLSLLASQPDFLQEIIESYGHKIIFYPHRNVFGSCIRFGSIKSNS